MRFISGTRSEINSWLSSDDVEMMPSFWTWTHLCTEFKSWNLTDVKCQKRPHPCLSQKKPIYDS